MNILIFLLIVCCELAWTAPYSVKRAALDFTAKDLPVKENQITYGWQLMPWRDWLKRPSSGPLFIPTEHDKNDIEVFEARAAGIVNKPISELNGAYLHNIDTVRRLDPLNKHTLLSRQPFRVETLIQFPPTWSQFITVGKQAKLLSSKTTDYIRMESAFGFASAKEISEAPRLAGIVQKLNIVGKRPDAVNLQGTVSVSQVAQFISIISMFYAVDKERTLVVSSVAVALKKHLLDLGVDSAGFKLTGRSLLLGENPRFNSTSGIGAGLPEYTLEFFGRMTAGMGK